MNFDHFPGTPGVYCITHIESGREYIGSSIHLRRRAKQHLALLRKNIHPSKFLQAVFSKYGENAFLVEIVENVIDVRLLLKREQFYIDIRKPLFNHRQIAESNLGLKYSLEARMKISVKRKGRVISHTESSRARISAALKGKKKSAQHVQRMAEALRGRKMSEDTKRKISATTKGRVNGPHAAERRRKISESKKLYHANLRSGIEHQ